jgi:hypothetical protein
MEGSPAGGAGRAPPPDMRQRQRGKKKSRRDFFNTLLVCRPRHIRQLRCELSADSSAQMLATLRTLINGTAHGRVGHDIA